MDGRIPLFPDLAPEGDLRVARSIGKEVPKRSSGLVSAKTSVLAGGSIGAALLCGATLRQLDQLRHGQSVVVEGDERLGFGDAQSSSSAEIQALDAARWRLRVPTSLHSSTPSRNGEVAGGSVHGLAGASRG